MTRTIVVFLNVFIGLVIADLTVIPSDTEVKVGHPVRFLCSTLNPSNENEIHWFRIPVGETEKDLVYGFKKFSPFYENRFQLENNFATGASNLLIPRVAIVDAGRYICQDKGGNGNRSSAQLIVLESTPVCQSNMRTDEVIGPNSCGIDADKLILSCSVSHHGNGRPALEWSKVGENIPIKEGVTYETIENTTTCNLSMRGDLSMDHASYECRAARAAAGTEISEMSCKSDAVKILYAFNSFSIIDKQLNDQFYCSANSSQSCSYEWKLYHDGTEKTLDPGRNQTLKDVGLYRCEANCKIKQKPCIVSVSLIHVSEADEADGGKTALIIILIILALALIAVLILFFVRRRSWRQREKRSGLDNGHDGPLTQIELGNAQDKSGLLVEEKEEEIRKLQGKLESSKNEKEQLLSQVQQDDHRREEEVNKLIQRQKELGKLLYQQRPDNIDYVMRSAGPVNTKTTVREMRAINGLAIIDKELFIVSHMSFEIEVYDSTTIRYNRGWPLIGLVNADDMTACGRNKCLYFSDRKNEGEEKEIMRVDPNGNVEKRWSTGDVFGRLSVTSDSNILLTVFSKNAIKEYTPVGQLIREIDVSSAGISHPLHTIKLATGHFVVSHGITDDPVHRVCIIDVDGDIIKSFGKKRGSAIGQMDGPICLAVDGEGCIIIADCNNSRLLLLNSILEYRRILDSDKAAFGYPVRVCLNQSNGRMFVADLQSANHRLIVFDLDKPSLPDPVKA